jgi:hypothetical protein
VRAPNPTHEELIRRAVKLLRTEGDPDAAARFVLDPLEYAAYGIPGGTHAERVFAKIAVPLDLFIRFIDGMRRVTKDDRRALTAYLKVLERLRFARNRVKHLDGVLLDVRFAAGEGMVLLETSPFQSLLSIDDEITITKVMLDRCGGAADKQARLAVSCAYGLLRRFKIPAHTTRNGAWCRLAAILYGDPTAWNLECAPSPRLVGVALLQLGAEDVGLALTGSNRF